MLKTKDAEDIMVLITAAAGGGITFGRDAGRRASRRVCSNYAGDGICYVGKGRCIGSRKFFAG